MRKFLSILISELGILLFLLFVIIFQNGWKTQVSKQNILNVILLLTAIWFLSVALVVLNKKHLHQFNFLFKKEIVYILFIILFGLMILYFIREIDPINNLTIFRIINKYHIPYLVFILFLLETVFYLSFEISTKIRNLGMSIFSLLEKYGILFLYGILIIFKLVVITPMAHSLVVYDDSYSYWLMAKHISSGYLNILIYNHYPPLYPLLISPVFFFPVKYQFNSMVVLNTIYSSTAVFPVYFLAKQFFSNRKSLLFTIVCTFSTFTILYPSLYLSENISYPLFFITTYFAFSNPPNKKLKTLWDVLLGVALGLSYLTRYMVLPLIPIFLFIWWIKPEVDSEKMNIRPSKYKINHIILMGCISLLIYALWFIPGRIQNVPVMKLLGFGVEGKSIITHQPISGLLFWIGFGILYIILISTPVLSQLFVSILNIRSNPFSNKTQRWFISISAIVGMLLFTTARHAWKAFYNYPEPQRFVGRYLIYIPILMWLTGFIASTELINISKKKFILSNILVFILAVISYQFLVGKYNLLGRFTITIFSLDINIIYGYGILYLPFIFIFLAILSILAIKGKNQLISMITLSFILIFYLGGWPYFFNKIISNNYYGRALEEIVNQVIDNPKFSYILNGEQKPELIIWKNIMNLDKELEIRGINPEKIIIETLPQNKLAPNKCKIDMILKYGKDEFYGIINKNNTCLVPKKDIISEYNFGGTTYLLSHIQDVSKIFPK
jgi:hypothetical protein